jgi:hypothetical protein
MEDAMKYMLLIYGAEGAWTGEERTACMVDSLAVCDQLAKQGKFFDAAPLQAAATAATVRVRDGRPLVTDGPFAETTEQLGGFYMLDLDDLDEAIAVASRIPPATKGTIEIRPVRPFDGPPAGARTRPRRGKGTCSSSTRMRPRGSRTALRSSGGGWRKPSHWRASWTPPVNT